MRRPTLLALLLAALPVFASGDARQLVQQAEQAYANGDHKLALALYDSAHATSTSAGLLYNIGNCYSKLGDVPHAILYYERALRLSPGAEDVQANLDLERTRLVDRVSQLPGFTLGSAWDRLRGGKDVDQWARRSLWACAIMALAAAGGLATRKPGLRRALYGVAAAAAVATVTSTALAAYRVQEATTSSEAIIMAPSAEILGEPRKGATRLFILHQGTKVGLMGTEGDWQEVRLANGSVGWMPAAQIEEI